MQHRGLVGGQPPRPGPTAARPLAQRGEPDIVLSHERDQIACNVRVAQVLPHVDYSRLSSGSVVRPALTPATKWLSPNRQPPRHDASTGTEKKAAPTAPGLFTVDLDGA